MGTLNSIIALQTSANVINCVQDGPSISSGSCIQGAEQNPPGHTSPGVAPHQSSVLRAENTQRDVFACQHGEWY